MPRTHEAATANAVVSGSPRNRGFEQEHRDARLLWQAGLREVVFPAGTYLMRIMHGVQCAGAA